MNGWLSGPLQRRGNCSLIQPSPAKRTCRASSSYEFLSLDQHGCLFRGRAESSIVGGRDGAGFREARTGSDICIGEGGSADESYSDRGNGSDWPSGCIESG